MNLVTTSTQPALAPVARETLTLNEFAAVMGISYRHAHDLAVEGAIPGAFRLGRRWVISRHAVDSMLGKSAQGAPN